MSFHLYTMSLVEIAGLATCLDAVTWLEALLTDMLRVCWDSTCKFNLCFWKRDQVQVCTSA